MKRIPIILAAMVLVLSGCSTYKQGQTPDDVYYSPGLAQEPVAAGQNENNAQSDYYTIPNDQYIHLKASNPDKWSYFDNYNSDAYAAYPGGYYGPSVSLGMSYGYSPYGFGYAPWIGFSYWNPMSFWNCYYTWNSFYNPYYGGVVVVNPKSAGYTYSVRTTTFNPASYTNTAYNRTNTRVYSHAAAPYSYSQTIRSNYNQTNSSNFRNYNSSQQFQRSGTYRPGTNSAQPTRTYSGSGFSGGGGGGGSFHSGGGVSRPGR